MKMPKRSLCLIQPPPSGAFCVRTKLHTDAKIHYAISQNSAAIQRKHIVDLMSDNAIGNDKFM